MVDIVSYWTSLVLKLLGITVHPIQLQYESVYKKYLGEDYKLDITDENYSLIISNHLGFFVRKKYLITIYNIYRKLFII